MSKRYVITNGTLLLHHNDGQSVAYRYGDAVEVDDLADHQKETVGSYTTSTDPGIRRPQTVSEIQNEGNSIDDSPEFRAAVADAGQVNSAVSPVPSNYDELSGDEAARFIRTLEQYPAQQAAVLEHELRREGRREVEDAVASDRVKTLAEIRAGIDPLAGSRSAPAEGGERVVTPVSELPEPEQTESLAPASEEAIERIDQTGAPAPSGEQLTGEALKDRAAELDIEGRSQMSADELRSAVAQAEEQE